MGNEDGKLVGHNEGAREENNDGLDVGDDDGNVVGR